MKKKDIKFDVALSFAGEQGDYVKSVAKILGNKGIKCFYDEFYKAQLWGTNLAEHLHNVYYSQSNFCIMFVSEEYVSMAVFLQLAVTLTLHRITLTFDCEESRQLPFPFMLSQL